MAFIKERFLDAAKAVEKALDEMGDFDAAGVVIIDDMDEITGNLKSAELREFFPPAQQKGEDEEGLCDQVILLTSNLGQDFDAMEKLTGDNGLNRNKDGAETPKGSLHEKFPNVQLKPLTQGVLKVLAERMIAESDLAPMLREGLCEIVKEDVIAQKKIHPGAGARALRAVINDYLRTPMTTEWEQELLSRSPTAIVINSLGKGTTRKMQAPKTARFRKPAQNGGGTP